MLDLWRAAANKRSRPLISSGRSREKKKTAWHTRKYRVYMYTRYVCRSGKNKKKLPRVDVTSQYTTRHSNYAFTCKLPVSAALPPFSPSPSLSLSFSLSLPLQHKTTLLDPRRVSVFIIGPLLLRDRRHVATASFNYRASPGYVS